MIRGPGNLLRRRGGPPFRRPSFRPFPIREFLIRRRALAGLVGLCGLLGAASPAAAETVRAAVAANFATAAREIASRFESGTGHRVLLSFGATGQLYAQIVQGAPFEVFLAADGERPALAEAAGLAAPGTRFTYAVGRLALVSRAAGLVRGPESLRGPEITRLALANPATAPYGRAAVETLGALGFDPDRTPFRLVQGTNVGQVFSFVHTGNADAGFVALSQTLPPTGDPGVGSRWVVPETMHAPIRQQAVLLRPGEDNAAAAAFLRFLRSAPVREILARRGYRTDGAPPPPPVTPPAASREVRPSPRSPLPLPRRRIRAVPPETGRWAFPERQRPPPDSRPCSTVLPWAR